MREPRDFCEKLPADAPKQQQISGAPREAAKKDEKTAAAIKKKLEALESSCTPLQDGDCSISRIMDCSTRCTLKNYDMTSVDIEGKNLHDMAETLGRAFGRGQFLTDRLNMRMIITYIDPDSNVGYIKHRQQQDAL